ncbi:ABC-type branched-subunit amino acid transport system substrate-binding protein [Bradyrhizobium sp. LM6.11]
MTSRRKLGMVLLGAMLGTAAAISVAQGAEPPLKVGLLEDVSGDLAFMGMPKLHGSQLAVEEINKSGGIMGRQIELIHLDPQGDNARYQEFGRRLLNRDKVDVLIGGASLRPRAKRCVRSSTAPPRLIFTLTSMKAVSATPA